MIRGSWKISVLVSLFVSLYVLGFEIHLEIRSNYFDFVASTEPVEQIDACSVHPERKIWAEKQCGILKSHIFSSCHTEVEVDGFVKHFTKILIEKEKRDRTHKFNL